MIQIRKKVEVICCSCNKSFLKDDSEVKRNASINRKNYCSLSCFGKVNTKHFDGKRTTYQLKSSNRRDEYTGFREHLRRLKYRNREVDLTLEDLKEVFDSQNGVCVYSKVNLIAVPKTGKSNPIYTMSLDRKDSNIGYIKSNIQFISIAMNHLKNAMTEGQIQEMLTILRYDTNSSWLEDSN